MRLIVRQLWYIVLVLVQYTVQHRGFNGIKGTFGINHIIKLLPVQGSIGDLIYGGAHSSLHPVLMNVGVP